jgi:rubrerythrin
MNKKELEVIKQAILNEVEGYEFYNMAAKHAAKGESKTAFLELANEELKHVEYLQKLFAKIKDNKEDDLSLALESDIPSPNIYNWDKVEREQSSLAMSVFNIGIQMERDSIEFYEEAKKNTELKEARELYDILIKWEKVHLDQFITQYNIQKENWWADQNFAPF